MGNIIILKSKHNIYSPFCRRFLRNKHGFTLIELLVVIAIIALLVSILMPSLNKARDLARSVLCMTNERGIIQATLIYANDYTTLPLFNPSTGVKEFDSMVAAGFTDLDAFAPSVICPQFETSTGLDKPTAVSQGTDYCLNYWLTHPYMHHPNVKSPPLMVEEISNPSSVVVYADNKRDWVAGFGGILNGIQTDYGRWSYRHGEDTEVNLVFLDSHVSKWIQEDAEEALYDGSILIDPLYVTP